MLNRYHVRIKDRRTTVSVPSDMAELLLIYLDTEPDSGEALSVVQQWMQDQIDKDPGLYRYDTSQNLQRQILFTIADQQLVERHLDWLLKEEN